MSGRHAEEIAKKKQKLAELRRAREGRLKQVQEAESAGAPVSLVSSRREVDSLVDSLLSSPRPSSPYAGPSRSSLASAGAPSGRSTPPATSSVPGTPAGRNSTGLDDLSREPAAPVPVPEIAVEYVDTYTEIYDMPSKSVKKETYSKAVQTAMVSTGTGTADTPDEDETEFRSGGAGRETEDEMRARIIAELDEERRVLEKELKELKEKTDSLQLHHLPDDQRQAILSAPDFSSFLEGSSRIVQRALSDSYDYIKDYTIGVEGAYDDGEGQKVKLFCAFADERWTHGRSVTDLDWSSKFPELVAASYNRNPSAPNDPEGIVAVWNLHLQERPEFVFHSPSDVLSVAFSPFQPTILFGGTYSGQVLVWDTRSKHLPVLKTPLSASGHTYPIYSMKMIGTQNAHSLITSSTDGLVCTWQTDILAQPQEALLLSMPAQPSVHNKTDEVSITCLDFAENETASFWVGTEEGSVYQANRYDRASAKAGLNPEDVYRGHAAPVTGLHFHPSTGSVDLSDLFLTTSVDWTVKLWRARPSAATKGVPSAPSSGVAPLHSFEEADDYVFDAKWHPTHPAVFGTVDGTGKFDLWNLNSDVEVPLVSAQVSNRALNKLAWDKGPGSRKVALGGSDGTVYVYDVAEKVVTPRESEWGEMQKNVQSLTAQRDGGLGLGALAEPSRYAAR